MLERYENPEWYPDPTGRAQRNIDWLERVIWLRRGLRGEGLLELAPWQKSVIRMVYGPHDSRGRREVQRCHLWMPRGCGKTAFTSALALLHFVGPERTKGGEIYLGAKDSDQSDIAFQNIRSTVKHWPALDRRLVYDKRSRLYVYEKFDAILKALTGESGKYEGLAASFNLIDEAHVWTTPSDRDRYNALVNSEVKVAEPMTYITSTAGEGEGGLPFELWEEALAAYERPEEFPATVSVMLSVPDYEPWDDISSVEKYHPGWNFDMVNRKKVTDSLAKAKLNNANERAYRRFYLNQWQTGVSHDTWLDMDIYDASANPRLTLEECRESNLEGFIGVDLGATDDLSAVVAIFRDPLSVGAGFVYHVFPKHFAPRKLVDSKGDLHRTDYHAAVRDGELVVGGARVMEYSTITEYIVSLISTMNVRQIFLDSYKSAFLESELRQTGVLVATLGQGPKEQAGPTRDTKNAILQGKFRHSNSRLLRQNFANAATDSDVNGNERLVKSRSVGKVDGAQAAIFAMAGAANIDGSYVNVNQILDAFIEASDEAESELREEALVY